MMYRKGKPIDKKEALRVLDYYPHIYKSADIDLPKLTTDNSDKEFADALVLLRTAMMTEVQ